MSFGRRTFLKLAGAAGAMVVIPGCSQEGEKMELSSFERLWTIDEARDAINTHITDPQYINKLLAQLDLAADGPELQVLLGRELISSKDAELTQISVNPQPELYAGGAGYNFSDKTQQLSIRLKTPAINDQPEAYHELQFPLRPIDEIHIFIDEDQSDLGKTLLLAKELYSLTLTPEDIGIAWDLCFPGVLTLDGDEESTHQKKLQLMLASIQDSEFSKNLGIAELVIKAMDFLGYYHFLPYAYSVYKSNPDDFPDFDSVISKMFSDERIVKIIEDRENYSHPANIYSLFETTYNLVGGYHDNKKVLADHGLA